MYEIAMGAPLGGRCYWINEQEQKYLLGDLFGGPPIWDTSGTRTAIPVWTRKNFKGTVQKIAILDTKKNELIIYKKTFSVLDFRTFDGNEIYGYDSPIHKPKTVHFMLDEERIEDKRTIKTTAANNSYTQ